MNILSLDLGTTTGWAFHDKSGHITSGIWCTRTTRQARFEGGGMRFLRFKRNLYDVLKSCGGNIDLVTFEEVRRHKGVDAAHIYGGFLSSLSSFCEENEIPYESVPVGTIKAFATGKGSASKDKMIKFAKSKGHNPIDDNEADAIAILYWSLEEYKYLL